MRFKLAESILTEAYDESIPEPIKDWFDHNRSYKEALIKNGIDLGVAKFKEYPKILSNRDPIFKDTTKQVFFVLRRSNGRSGYNIYAKGINDDQQFYFDNNGNWVSNKYLSAKKLMNDSDYVYYIDLTDPSNLSADKRKQRADYDLAHDPNRRYDVKDLKDNSWSYRNGRIASRDKSGIKRQLPKGVSGVGADLIKQLDKSGYYKDPQKYQRKMIELGMFDYAKKLEKIFQGVMEVKDLILASFNNISEQELAADRQVFSSFSNAVQRIRDALNSYGDLESQLKEYDNCLDRGWMTKEDYARSVKSDLDSYGPSILRDAERAKKEFNDYISAVIDWDTDDYIDDED